MTVPRDGTARLTVRRLGYGPHTRTLSITSDTIRVDVLLSQVAQPLAPVVVDESVIDMELREIGRAYRAVDHAQVFGEAQFKKSGQLQAGSFLLGQGGLRRVPCQRSQGFLPPGKVRTVPVEHEPADNFWPCVMRRGKPVSVLVSIDGGPAREFTTISTRELDEFAMMVVIHGSFIHAYTKLFVKQKASARQ